MAPSPAAVSPVSCPNRHFRAQDMSITPIADAIEKDVTDEARRHGLVLWLDTDRLYGQVAERMAGKQDAAIPVVCFRGSYLETMLALESHGGEEARRAMILHLPGLTEELLRQSPLYEYRVMGRVHTVSLERILRAVATGQALPHAIDSLAARPGLTVEAAESWLAEQVQGLGDDTILRAMPIETVVESLLGCRDDQTAFVAVEDIASHLHRSLGMDPTWRDWFPLGARPTVRKLLAFQLAGWLMAVEYVHDLNRPPALPQLKRLKDLPEAAISTCRTVIAGIRTRYAELYAPLADKVELELAGELAEMAAADLGRIDTFRAEEARVLKEAVDQLMTGRFAEAAEWARHRLDSASLWLKLDPKRAQAWNLVAKAAAFGNLIDAHARPLEGCRSVDEAVERYKQASAVDGTHRQFEQERFDCLDPYLAHFREFSEVVELLRSRYRVWADGLASAFADLCRERGFLPDDHLRQRNLFDDEIMPLVQTGDKVAFLMVDALRYEMAAELRDSLDEGGKVDIRLDARLAELPTVTSVGMNALPPVTQAGRLRPILDGRTITGFRTGDFSVRGWPDRARAIGSRAIGQAVPVLTMAQVCDPCDKSAEKALKASKLVVVRALDIDDAGETELGLAAFSSILEQLRSACRHLANLGVKHFVITADHGFLLLDPTRPTADGFPQAERRHALLTAYQSAPDSVCVSLQSLGYEGDEGWLLFRSDTAVFQAARAGATFVHGGNSLQERVIPVLTISREPVGKRRKAQAPAWKIEARRGADAMGMYRIELVLGQAEAQLGFVCTELAVALKCDLRPDVRAVIKDVVNGRVERGRILVSSADRTEVFFTLEGSAGGRVQLTADAIDGAAAPETLADWFDVVATTVPHSAPSSAIPAGWDAEIADDGARRVFRHLEAHGIVSEEEVIRILGTPRAARRFTLEFETWKEKLPFRVRVETGDNGKRYVKENA